MNQRSDKLQRGCPYTRVEYLENVGWSRVFLPVYPKAGDVVVVESELCYTDVSFRQSELAGSAAPWFFWGVYDTPTWYAGGNDTLYSQAAADTDWHVLKLVSLGETAGLWVDGQKIIDINQYPDVVYAPQGMELWSYSNGRRNSLNKKKWLRISINGKLVMHLLPVLDDNGTPALYDTVSRLLFYNTGEDALVAGPVTGVMRYTPVEYIESTGTQYCNIPVQVDGSGLDSFSSITNILFLGGSRQLMGFSTNACCYWGINAECTAVDLGGDILLPIEGDSPNIINYTRVQNSATVECSGKSVTRTTADTPILFSFYGLLSPAIQHVAANACSARVSEVLTYESGVLTHHLLPVVDDVNVACFHDVVTGNVFYSEGEEPFLAGPRVYS